MKAGQPLIQLHVAAASASSRPTRRRRSQDLAVAQKALERAHKLQADGAVSEKEVAQAEADFKKAKSDARARRRAAHVARHLGRPIRR